MRVCIVGLDVVGTSMGLALKAATSDIVIVAHDPNASREKRAKQLGAIDKSHWNLISACDKAELILLDLSLVETEKTLTALADTLSDGTLIVDTATTKRPFMEMTQRLLPSTVCFVGGHLVAPRLSRTVEPAAELLKGATFYLVAPVSAPRKAIDMATLLATAVGASPQFIDAEEHDGLVAATAQLPAVAALALLQAISSQAGQRDRANSAGAGVAALVGLVEELQAGSMEALVRNADNVVHWLDLYGSLLGQIRDLLSAGDTESLSQRTTEALTVCGNWQGSETTDSGLQDSVSVGWRSMFMGGLGSRRPSDRRKPK